jgi:hypothetical protein
MQIAVNLLLHCLLLLMLHLFHSIPLQCNSRVGIKAKKIIQVTGFQTNVVIIVKVDSMQLLLQKINWIVAYAVVYQLEF